MPGHVGVSGNERDDKLSRTAAVEIRRAVDRADILNAIKEPGREKMQLPIVDLELFADWKNATWKGVWPGYINLQAAKEV